MIATCLALVRFADPAGQELGALQPTAEWLFGHRVTFAVFLLSAEVALHLLQWVAGRFGPRVNVAKAEHVLNCAVERLFEQQDLSKHVYRATLFRVKTFWLCGSWLGAVARSGQHYRRLSATFSIDSEEWANNTGFAGECWRQGGATIMSPIALPDQQIATISDEDRDNYKIAGYLADEEYNGMSVRARVFLATGIRLKGELWGVLVLDSTDAATLPNTQTQKRRREVLTLAAESLALLLS